MKLLDNFCTLFKGSIDELVHSLLQRFGLENTPFCGFTPEVQTKKPLTVSDFKNSFYFFFFFGKSTL